MSIIFLHLISSQHPGKGCTATPHFIDKEIEYHNFQVTWWIHATKKCWHWGWIQTYLTLRFICFLPHPPHHPHTIYSLLVLQIIYRSRAWVKAFIQRMSWGRALRRRGMREAGWGREPVSKNRATMSLALAWSDRAHGSPFRIHPTWGKRGTPAGLSLSVDGPPWLGWRALWSVTSQGSIRLGEGGPEKKKPPHSWSLKTHAKCWCQLQRPDHWTAKLWVTRFTLG